MRSTAVSTRWSPSRPGRSSPPSRPRCSPAVLGRCSVTRRPRGSTASAWAPTRKPWIRAGAVDELELTVVGADRRRPGLVIHRVRELSPADHLRLQRLPVTSVARTVLDLSVGLPDRALEHMIDEALKRTSRARLAEAVGRHPGRPGTPRVKALLDPERPSSDTWSHAEERLLQLVRRAGLPVPEVNVLLGAYIPDLLWRERRIIVEFDSRAHHSGPAAVRRDAARHNDLTSQGYQIIHITWGDLVESPERVVAWIATALARAGG
jgi:very-short-patch-repair endonuclease